MKNFLKISLITLLLVPTFAFATPTSWDFANSILQPLQSMWSAQIKGSYFTATSTTQHSTFPYASTTAISATTASTTNLIISSLTTGRIPFITTAGRLLDSSSFTFDGSNLVVGGDVSSNSVTTNTVTSGGSLEITGGNGLIGYQGNNDGLFTHEFFGQAYFSSGLLTPTINTYQSDLRLQPGTNDGSGPYSIFLDGGADIDNNKGNVYINSGTDCGGGACNGNAYIADAIGNDSSGGTVFLANGGSTGSGGTVNAVGGTNGLFNIGDSSHGDANFNVYGTSYLGNYFSGATTTAPGIPSYGRSNFYFDNDGLPHVTVADGTDYNLVGGSGCTTLDCLTDVSLGAPVASTTLFSVDGTTFTNRRLGYGDIITGFAPVNQGGTGLTSTPTFGQLLVGNSSSGYTLRATSTLNIALSDTVGTLSVSKGGTGSTTLTGILKGAGTGSVVTATPGTDYEVPITFSSPLSRSGNTVSFLFNTTNTWTGPNTFNSLPSVIGTPVNGNDAVNKTYADGIASGIKYKDPVTAATTTNLTLSGIQNVDQGVVGISGARVLLMGQSTTANNGCYTQAAGAWTRCTDYDSAAEVTNGTTFLVLGGTSINPSTLTTNGSKLFAMTAPSVVTLGTDPITFSLISATQSLTCTLGITCSGSNIQTNLLTSGGLYTSANQLGVLHDNSTLSTSTGVLAVKDLGITAAKLAAGSIDLQGTKIGSNPLLTTLGGTGLTSWTQGDIPYYTSGTALSKLAKDTNSTRYLSNQGTSNAPSWNQVNLTNGVTGTLPIANGGTGQITANAALNALLPSQTSNSGLCLSTNGTDTLWTTCGSGGGGSGTNTATTTRQVTDLPLANTTFQNTDLKFNIGANESYTFRVSLQAQINGTSDLKYQVTGPSGATCIYQGTSLENGASPIGGARAAACSTSVSILYSNGTHNAQVIIDGTVSNGATPGTIQVQTALNSGTSASTIFAGSLLQAISTSTSSSASSATFDWQKETNFNALALTPTTTIPIWIKDKIYASSTIISSATSASTFPYASSTSYTVSGNFYAGRSQLGDSSTLTNVTNGGLTYFNGTQDVRISGSQTNAVFGIDTWNGSGYTRRFTITGATAAATTNLGPDGGAVTVGAAGAAGAGTLLVNGTGKNMISLDATGANYGHIENLNSTTWGLGYGGSSASSLGTNVLSWNSSGRVGINITAPNRRLEIDGATDDYQIRLGNGVASGGSSVYTYDIGRNYTTGVLNFYGNQTGFTGYAFGGVDGTRMTIDTSGKVGIGTTTGLVAPLNVYIDKGTTAGNFSGVRSTIKKQDVTGTVSAGEFEGVLVDGQLSAVGTSTGVTGIGSTSGTVSGYGNTIGVRGMASGALNNWAGYFDIGNTYIGGKLAVGTTTPFATVAINPTAGQASNQFVIGSSTGTSLIVNNSGLVGVGTTTPIEPLTVRSKVGGDGILVTGTTSLPPAVSLRHTGTNDLMQVGLAPGFSNFSASGDGVIRTLNSKSLILTASAGGDIKFGTGSNGTDDTAKMVIKNNGTVVVGGTTANSEGYLTVTGAGYLQLAVQSTTSSAGIKMQGVSGDIYEMQNNSGEFLIYNRTDNRYDLDITETGNVGIGMNASGYKLEVNGTLAATALTDQAGAFPACYDGIEIGYSSAGNCGSASPFLVAYRDGQKVGEVEFLADLNNKKKAGWQTLDVSNWDMGTYSLQIENRKAETDHIDAVEVIVYGSKDNEKHGALEYYRLDVTPTGEVSGKFTRPGNWTWEKVKSFFSKGNELSKQDGKELVLERGQGRTVKIENLPKGFTVYSAVIKTYGYYIPYPKK
jgi:hypothetical protein